MPVTETMSMSPCPRTSYVEVYAHDGVGPKLLSALDELLLGALAGRLKLVLVSLRTAAEEVAQARARCP